MDEKEVVSLNKQQVFELVQIIFNTDKDAAFTFLEESIYKPLQKRKEAKCKTSL